MTASVPLWLALIGMAASLVAKPVLSWIIDRMRGAISKGAGILEAMPGATPDQVAKVAKLASQLSDALANAMSSAVSDMLAGNWRNILQDAVLSLKSIVTPDLVPELEAAMGIGSGQLWAFLAGRLGLMSGIGKALMVTPEKAVAFDKLATADKRAMVAAWGHLLPAMAAAKAA